MGVSSDSALTRLDARSAWTAGVCVELSSCRAQHSGRATSSPMKPAVTMAAPRPAVAITTSTKGGAIAPPMKPAKV